MPKAAPSRLARALPLQTSYEPYWANLAPMGNRSHHVRQATGSTRKPRHDLLEVWLGLFERIEGPRRRRAEEFRRRHYNPMRRVVRRASHLRAFGASR